MLVGYARVSSTDQSLEIQLDELATAGCEKVFSERVTGTSTDARDQLKEMLDYIREGDVVIVSRLDRLARSLSDLLEITATIKAKNADLKVLHQPIDTSSAFGKMTMQLLGAFAEFETEIRRERQFEGIEKAKKRGVYRGRKATIDSDQIKALRTDGLSPTAIAKKMGIARSSVYRSLQS